MRMLVSAYFTVCEVKCKDSQTIVDFERRFSYCRDMKDMGSPFKEIDGPGVDLVEAMEEFEKVMLGMGVEVEYVIEPDREARST